MQLSFTPVGSYYLVAILVAVLVVLLMLGPARDKVSPGRRRVLIGLRLLVILLVLLAMLRPRSCIPRSFVNRRRWSCSPIDRAACRSKTLPARRAAGRPWRQPWKTFIQP